MNFRKPGTIAWMTALLALAFFCAPDSVAARGGGGGGGGGGGRGGGGGGGARGGGGRSGSGRALNRQSNKKKDPKDLETDRERMRQLDYRDADARSDRGAL